MTPKRPFGNGAGLIEEDGIDLGGVLQHRAAAHQDAAPRQASDGRHHGRGRRQNQRAGAGHDQHRDGAQPVAREVEGEPGGQQQRRKEIARKAIRQPLHRRALLARILHQLDDARERGFGAGARDGDAQQAQAVSVPEKTSSPALLSRGSGSPVMVLSSMLEAPC